MDRLTRQQRLAEQHLRTKHGLDLEAWLLKNREGGLGYEEISRELYSVTDGAVSVSYQTIKRWLQQAEKAAA